MLRLSGLRLDRGPRTLYRDVTVTASDGERVGLVGANGSGKSSLLGAILGRVPIDSGSIDAPPPDRIGWIDQDIESTAERAIDFVMSGHAPLTKARDDLQAALQSRADDQKDLHVAQAYAHLADLNEGAIAAEARAILSGLGLSQAQAQGAVSDLSGGQRNRLALARVLLQPADLLLLDEPTNHLDLDSIVWLENWLRRQKATVVVVSHDREFLDRCTDTIWHVADQSIVRYTGNYSAFESAWLDKQRHVDAQVRRQQRTIEHLSRFVERFRAKATKARQAQSRLKMLERLERLEPMREQREWRFRFFDPLRLPAHLVDGEHLQLGYPYKVVLDSVRLSVRAGDRIGVLGVNGAGKSTLIKAIVGELAPMAGELRRSPGTVIGYFAQHQLEDLDPRESPLELLRRIAPDAREQELRDFLGSFRFGAELACSPVGRLSGGERARCALALLAWRRPNLLVMDEPTNHLDMATREALTVALSSFEGALIVVSHDRHLLRATTDQLWLVHEARMDLFDGDLDDYAAWVIEQRRAQARSEAGASELRHPGEQRRQAAGERERLARARRPLQARLDAVEQRMQSVSEEMRDLDARLASEAFYSGDPEPVSQALKRRAQLDHALRTLEEQWFELQSQLDAIV
ncbi:MAG TPA: ATP-binding cassette domain-containing protein [Burkholderiaceae bacterium]|jgi:ATP-binding cassette subfamily F protein 3|nr:ATP-binding cassette domain-containing protein [Burkholderiaceae bacterium]